jgi:hypothetical protein
MVKQIKIGGIAHPYVMSMATIESFVFNNDVKITDMEEFFASLTTKQLKSIIYEGFKVGAMIQQTDFQLEMIDIERANANGEISFFKMAEDLNTAVDESELGK